MTYEFKIKENDGYVHVQVTGKRQDGEAVLNASHAGRRIVEFCRQASNYRVLVVLNLSGRLSTMDSYEIATGSEEYGWDRIFKLAFVNPNKSSVDDVKFTETVAVNRAYSVKAFADEPDAVAWLLAGSA